MLMEQPCTGDTAANLPSGARGSCAPGTPEPGQGESLLVFATLGALCVPWGLPLPVLHWDPPAPTSPRAGAGSCVPDFLHTSAPQLWGLTYPGSKCAS